MEKEVKGFDLHIIDRMNKIPGGFMLVPLILAVIINSVCPQLFRIGGVTTALFVNGGNTLMAVYLITCGSMINIRQVGMSLYKGIVLVALKFFIGVGIGMLVGAVFGSAGIFGITPMIAIAAFTNSNSSLFVVMAGRYGKSSDTGAISVLCLKDGPFLTLVAMGATGLGSFGIKNFAAILFPIFIGFVWGNVDEKFRTMCKQSQTIIIFFMIFAIASSLTLTTLVQAGIIGIVLGIISALLGFVYFVLYNLFLPKKERNAVGASIGTTAVNAAMTPTAVASADPSYAPQVESATSMISAAAAVSLLICPFITTMCDNYMRKRKLGIYSAEAQEQEEEQAVTL